LSFGVGGMGATAWSYLVDYQPDINAALQALRKREFEAGRYSPAIDYAEFPLCSDHPGSGAKHASIEAAIEDADADGTQTILDIREISEERLPGTASPLEPLELLNVFGTEIPTVDMVEDEDEVPCEIFDFIGRGQSVYIILYKDRQPKKLLFVGYSYD
jgi:hypothetical protein